MLQKTVFLVFLALFTICCKYSSSTKYPYPELFRDHVSDILSEKGKEMFYAINIHPSCTEKKGRCIPRAQCVGKEVLYLSRICYKRDLVCCYDNTIRFPVVGDDSHTTKRASTTTVATRKDAAREVATTNVATTDIATDKESNAMQTSF